jgi:TolB-like protein
MNFIIAILICLAAPVMASAQGLSIMVHEMTVDIQRGTDTRIAVLEFNYADNKTSQGPAIVQERITTALVKKRVGTVVERKLLDRVMGELKLQRSGMMDERTIKQIGKTLGVDYVVTGTLNDVSDTKTEVNARVIDVETAKVIGASSTEMPKTWRDVAPTVTASEPMPVADDTKSLIRTKAYMDNKLAQLRAAVGTDIKPRTDGQLEVKGQAVDGQDFTAAVMKTMLNDAKEAGLDTSTMTQEAP